LPRAVGRDAEARADVEQMYHCAPRPQQHRADSQARGRQATNTAGGEREQESPGRRRGSTLGWANLGPLGIIPIHTRPSPVLTGDGDQEYEAGKGGARARKRQPNSPMAGRGGT